MTNNSSTNIKLSKIQLHKTGQSRRFLGRLLGPLLKTFTDAAIQFIYLFFFGLGMTTIISNEEMHDIMKIIKLLEESGLFIKGLVKQFKMKQKNKMVDFLASY